MSDSNGSAIIGQRTALMKSDLLLLADNAETQRWLGGIAHGSGDSIAARATDRFLREAWARVGSSYAALSYLDYAERRVASFVSLRSPAWTVVVSGSVDVPLRRRWQRGRTAEAHHAAV